MSSKHGDDISVEIVSWETHREPLRAIREPVFIQEQQVPAELEWDEHEDAARHFLVRSHGEPVACGRLTPDGKVGRMAVLKQYRGQGLGRVVLDSIIAQARSEAMPRLFLHAQQHAAEFYSSAGFTVVGEPFDEAGIPHIGMEMPLQEGGAGRFVSGVAYPQPFDEFAVALCADAARQLCILSPSLDHRVFDNAELSQAMSQLARQSRQTEIRILIKDSRPLVARGHRLLTLARRIPSSVRIQKLAEHPDWNNETIVIRDRDGVLYKPGGSEHDGFFEPDSRASTRKHLELFEDLWRYSVQDIELRSLSL